MHLKRLLLLFGLTANAYAGDLSSLKACVTNGYSQLKNRHAIAVAVLDDKDSEILLFGAAKEDQIFEIGSITKTFTGNLLAQAVLEGMVELSDPIPPQYQKLGTTITYQHLATHTSGITGGLFNGYVVHDSLKPFDGLTIPLFKSLYAQNPLQSVPGTAYAYSNMGMSLLGLVLSEPTGYKYEELIENKILNVLGMSNTGFVVPQSEQARFPEGQMVMPDGSSGPVPHWDLNGTAVDPAGGLRSTIADMALYARAHLVPEKSALGDSVRLAQKPLYYDPTILQAWIGINWIVEPDGNLIWHNGETYGFNSILAISKRHGQAVVALTDTTVLQKNNLFSTDFQDVAFTCLQ